MREPAGFAIVEQDSLGAEGEGQADRLSFAGIAPKTLEWPCRSSSDFQPFGRAAHPFPDTGRRLLAHQLTHHSFRHSHSSIERGEDQDRVDQDQIVKGARVGDYHPSSFRLA